MHGRKEYCLCVIRETVVLVNEKAVERFWEASKRVEFDGENGCITH